MIDAKTIEELRGLLAKATLGPWSTHLVDDTTIMSPAREVATTCDSSQTDREDGYDIEYEQMEADAALIVAMRNALPALLDRLEKAEGELAEAREDVRSLCRFILNEWGPDGALKATTFALEQRQSAKGGDANAAPDRDTNSKSATSPGVTAGASAGEDGELCKRVDDTLQAMAALASVPMDLWDRHSNAVLELIAQVRSLSLRVEAEKRAREEAAAIAKDLADRGYSGDAIAAALRSRT